MADEDAPDECAELCELELSALELACVLRGVVEGAGLVADGVRLSAAPTGLLPPLEVSASIVTASRTTTSASVPIRSSLRRQYTDGGWDPTG